MVCDHRRCHEEAFTPLSQLPRAWLAILIFVIISFIISLLTLLFRNGGSVQVRRGAVNGARRLFRKQYRPRGHHHVRGLFFERTTPLLVIRIFAQTRNFRALIHPLAAQHGIYVFMLHFDILNQLLRCSLLPSPIPRLCNITQPPRRIS